jgi:UDPglucose--hexose-1-phosphate uridylyltransferase
MPEFRQNMVSKEWVIIATERAKRPDQFLQKRREETFLLIRKIALSVRETNR